jgi:hypothetical protein
MRIFNSSHEDRRMIFPRPFAVAIDDMGWNNGSHLGKDGGEGPSRAGVDRHFSIRDYEILVEVGQTVGVRLQGLFVLCEMDRDNVCAKYPTTTMYGSDWDNSGNVCDEQLAVMNLVKNNAAYIEFGIHGVGHEYWPEKMHRVRAEWYNLLEKKPWPEENLRDHFKCFLAIMSQYGLNIESGHSFPESFAPCAYSFYWNPEGEYSLGKLLNENGVKYANTSFSYIGELNPPKEPDGGGFDHGVHVINRNNYGNKWFEPGVLPVIPLQNQQTDIIETHFINWLAPDDTLQQVTTEKWITYFQNVQRNEGRYLAKNTEQLHSQWLYRKFTKVEEKNPGDINIDNSEMDDDVYKHQLLGNMVLKIKLESAEHISGVTLDDQQIASYFEQFGFAFLYLPPLAKKKYALKYTIGSRTMESYVFNNGTYNIYRFESTRNRISFDIKMYGYQIVMIKCKKPAAVCSSNKYLKILSENYDLTTGFLSLGIFGRNFCGERGTISLSI